MAWTTPRTWTEGETVTGSMMNTHVRDNTSWIDSLGVAYRDARAYANSAQTLTRLVYSKINLNTESWDTNSEFSTSTNRFTAAVQMRVLVCGVISFNGGGNNSRVAIYKNGAIAYEASLSVASGSYCQPNAAIELYLNASDYVEMFGYHAAATNQPIDTGSAATWMTVSRVGN